MHETFSRALRALDRGQHPDRFDLWIRRITLSAFADHYRRPYVRHEESTDPRTLPEDAAPSGDRDLASLMRALIEGLDQNLRDVVVLHFYEDLSVQEVAAVLVVPPGTVKSRLHRAYRRLGTALAAEERGPAARRPGPSGSRQGLRVELSGGRHER